MSLSKDWKSIECIIDVMDTNITQKEGVSRDEATGIEILKCVNLQDKIVLQISIPIDTLN